jgi:uncharacterized membrane protein YeaQ/YmgE (transglycosylase-associated protein family)
MFILNIIIQVVAGIMGGSLAARINARNTLNSFINLFLGLIGGVAGGQILGKLGMTIFIGDRFFSSTGAMVNIIGSGCAGALLVNLISSIKEATGNDEE